MEDSWEGDKPLKLSYPMISLLSFYHKITVVDAINTGWGGFSFRRTLLGESVDLGNILKNICDEVRMLGGRDQIGWMLTADRSFL